MKNRSNAAKNALRFLKWLSPMEAANDMSFKKFTLQELVQVILPSRYACEAVGKAHRKLEFCVFSCASYYVL